MKYAFIAGFFVMVAAQWYAPLSMIYSSNETIEQGVEYKFKTRPVDPSDPFRGKYITLDFEVETLFPADTTGIGQFKVDQEVYAMLYPDPDGYAKVMQLFAEPPPVGDYIPVNFNYIYMDSAFPSFSLTVPFKRFYLEESKASEAERLYWDNARNDSTTVCWGKVMVHDGKATLTDVLIGNQSITDIVASMNLSED